MAQLTTKQVRELDKPGRYGDGRGLYLVVTKTGTKQWVQRIWLNGKRTDKGLGGFPAVSLSEARKITDRNRVSVEGGAQSVGRG